MTVGLTKCSCRWSTNSVTRSSVRPDGHAELRGHQHDGEVLVHAAEPAAVDLAEVDRFGLQQLLEDDAVLRVLAGGHADRAYGVPYRRMSQHVVRARRLLDPPRIELRERLDAIDRLVDVPTLVRVDHQPVLRADLFTHQADARRIVPRRGAHFDLEMRPALRQRLAAQMTDLLV